MITLAQGYSIANTIVKRLAPLCDEIEVAGSIRRERPFVGDVDIVLLPKARMRAKVEERILQHTTPVKNGPQYMVVTMEGGVQLDFWFAHAGEPEESDMLQVTKAARPGNFGTLMICRTGSKEHNIYLASRALSLGLNWQPHTGVVRAGRVIASATEHDVFKALQLDYVAPEKREL